MNKKKVIILTGSELRHEYFFKFLSDSSEIDVVAIYCEGLERSLGNTLSENPKSSELEYRHFNARTESEIDFFQSFITKVPNKKSPKKIKYGSINEKKIVEELLSHDAELIVCFGCSIVGKKILDSWHGNIINAHLGLSPYYRGSGTNVWPLINNEPDLVGVTFMNMDYGIDTGEIIHQIRARVFLGDSPHTIGNRLIKDMCKVYVQLIINYDNLKLLKQPDIVGKVYKIADFNADACRNLYDNFNNGMIEIYLNSGRTPNTIIENPGLKL